MSKYAFKIDIKGTRKEILQAPWMKEYIQSVAEKEKGADTHVRTFIGYNRAKAIIYPNTKEHNA